MVRNIHAMCKVDRRYREVPHDLTEAHAQGCLETCQKLLQNPYDERFVIRIGPRIGGGTLGQTSHESNAKWNLKGIIYFEMVPDNRTINAELYSAQLDWCMRSWEGNTRRWSTESKCCYSKTAHHHILSDRPQYLRTRRPRTFATSRIQPESWAVWFSSFPVNVQFLSWAQLLHIGRCLDRVSWVFCFQEQGVISSQKLFHLPVVS